MPNKFVPVQTDKHLGMTIENLLLFQNILSLMSMGHSSPYPDEPQFTLLLDILLCQVQKVFQPVRA